MSYESTYTVPIPYRYVDLDALEALAKASSHGSHGPWEEEEHTNAIIISGTEGFSANGSALAIAETVYRKEDRAYIAAVSPEIILSLIAEIRRNR